MARYAMDAVASDGAFDEEGYLLANPDVAEAVRLGGVASGRQHFDLYGRQETPVRRMRTVSAIREAKRAKVVRILPLLRPDVAAMRHDAHIDTLSESSRRRWGIVDTAAVSGHGYSADVTAIVDRHADGLVLDVGAGCRPVYFDNVVNYEIVPYDTTDVLGVAEELPFRDGVFDAVISVAVLEHVKDPFRCAAEMVRVLKPGGDLYCEALLLQPFHAYPNHYYNMTQQGLLNLFGSLVTVDKVWCRRTCTRSGLLPGWCGVGPKASTSRLAAAFSTCRCAICFAILPPLQTLISWRDCRTQSALNWRPATRSWAASQSPTTSPFHDSVCRRCLGAGQPWGRSPLGPWWRRNRGCAPVHLLKTKGRSTAMTPMVARRCSAVAVRVASVDRDDSKPAADATLPVHVICDRACGTGSIGN